MMRGYIFNIMSEKIARKLRQDLYNAIVNKDVAFFDARKTGDLCKLYLTDFSLVSRLNSDTSVI